LDGGPSAAKIGAEGIVGNYIKHANLDILDGVLRGTMEFSRHLNLISGENGTLKTRLLQALQSEAAVPAEPGEALRVQAISPKRNSERRAVNAIIQSVRQQNRTFDQMVTERLAAQLNDTGYAAYPSLGELHYLVFDERRRDGGDQHHHMEEVTKEFNHVIGSIFEHYELLADWDITTGAPNIRIRKHEDLEIPIEALSLGEQEILSLAANLYASRKRVDVFLIDEPEVHLNWHLEERLFGFLNALCEDHDKQAIVVTHSRAIFKPTLITKCQFLFWTDDGNVKWGRQLARDQQRRLVGDAIETIRLGEFTRPTFFVEDDAHARVLGHLAEVLDVEVSIAACGSKSCVRSLFKYSKEGGGWEHAYFMEDGDNEGNPFPGDPAFIHLPCYCVECFLCDPEVMAEVVGKSPTDVCGLIASAIKSRRAEILKKNKFFEFLVDSLNGSHITHKSLKTLDVSKVLPGVIKDLGWTLDAFSRAYLQRLKTSGTLDAALPGDLLAAFRSARPPSVASVASA
jgi:energy-coupling factor transporter ATP-binding protein EcfA2